MEISESNRIIAQKMGHGAKQFLDAQATTGGHHDTGDVFFLALEGEKEWTVEYQPDIGAVNRLSKAQPKMDLEPANETTTLLLSPGDYLYIPPYTDHRVRSNGPSLGVSFGLPAFNAIQLLTYQLSSLSNRVGVTR